MRNFALTFEIWELELNSQSALHRRQIYIGDFLLGIARAVSSATGFLGVVGDLTS